MITSIYRALMSCTKKFMKKRSTVEVSPSKEPASRFIQEGYEVVMYCTNWCPDCKKARIWLNQNKIDFKEIDIDRVSSAKDQLRKITGGTLTTPTFVINDKIVVDFNTDELEILLNLR